MLGVETVDTARLYTSSEVVAATGASYRQLDYWARLGVVQGKVEARGSGSKRLFSFEQLLGVRAVTVLAAMGAQVPILRRVAEALAADPTAWQRVVVVSAELGLLVPLWDFAQAGGGYLVDLPAERAAVMSRLVEQRLGVS